jgi:hypothetical protein
MFGILNKEKKEETKERCNGRESALTSFVKKDISPWILEICENVCEDSEK